MIRQRVAYQHLDLVLAGLHELCDIQLPRRRNLRADKVIVHSDFRRSNDFAQVKRYPAGAGNRHRLPVPRRRSP